MPGKPKLADIAPESGSDAGNTHVTLHGSSLKHISTVMFGTTPASQVTSEGTTHVTCVSPPGDPGTVPVIAWDFYGNATNPLNYTYYED